MSDTARWPGITVTNEMNEAIMIVTRQHGMTQAYLIREGLAMLLAERYQVIIESPHPQRGGYRKKEE